MEQPGTYAPIDPRIYILKYQWPNEAVLLMRARTRMPAEHHNVLLEEALELLRARKRAARQSGRDQRPAGDEDVPAA